MSLQRRIGAWHREVFPIEDSEAGWRILRKFEEESAEFLDRPFDRSEAADCVICLMGYADRLGFDLLAEVEKKFAVVKARTDQVERDTARGIAHPELVEPPIASGSNQNQNGGFENGC